MQQAKPVMYRVTWLLAAAEAGAATTAAAGAAARPGAGAGDRAAKIQRHQIPFRNVDRYGPLPLQRTGRLPGQWSSPRPWTGACQQLPRPATVAETTATVTETVADWTRSRRQKRQGRQELPRPATTAAEVAVDGRRAGRCV